MQADYGETGFGIGEVIILLILAAIIIPIVLLVRARRRRRGARAGDLVAAYMAAVEQVVAQPKDAQAWQRCYEAGQAHYKNSLGLAATRARTRVDEDVQQRLRGRAG